MVKIEINKKYLITTDNFFIAPNGEQYNAVFGTVSTVESDEENLYGNETNMGYTKWYVVIGNMIVAGDQIHYCIQTDSVLFRPGPKKEMVHEGNLTIAHNTGSRIYNADA